MKKYGGEANEGFTIIEVALVLAIGGLILVMVFLALPALQRSERDAERRENVMLLLRKIRDYQTANRGALPGQANTNETVVWSSGMSPSDGTWAAFYKDFLGENFQDPRTAEHYQLRVTPCGDSVTLGGTCTSLNINGNKVRVGTNVLAEDEMWVIRQASCEYDDGLGFTVAKKSSNPRKVAVMYNLETSGAFCQGS